jgi:hypothetical protein
LPTHNRTCPWTKARLIYAFLLPYVVCKAYGSGLALGRGRVESMLATGRQKCIKTPRVTRERGRVVDRRRTTRRPRAPDERSLKRWYLSRHQRSNILTLCIILNPIQCSWDQLNSNRQHTVHRMSHDLFTVQISVCACGSSIRTECQQRVAEEPEPWIRRDTSRRRNTPQQQVLRHPWAFPTLRLFCCPNFYSEASCKALHEKRGHVHVGLAVVPQ